MKIISTRVHGILDYAMGALLIAAPWLFGFDAGGAETWIPVFLGVSTIIYSLLTDFELGASPQISMKTHLGLDAASGLLLAASPWLFGFSEIVYLPHLILGILELGAVAMTETQVGKIENKETEINNSYGAEHRKEINKAENFSDRKSNPTAVSPQKTASTSMHNRRDHVHKTGIHNKDEKASEPYKRRTEESSSQDSKSSQSNVNRMPSQQSQNKDFQKSRDKNYVERPAASLDNSMKQNNSLGKDQNAGNSGSEKTSRFQEQNINNRPRQESTSRNESTIGNNSNQNQTRQNPEAQKPQQNPNKESTGRNTNISSKTENPTNRQKNQGSRNQDQQ